ncbi:MAG: monovalent cation:proton antiporter family protein [Candidatus Eremiobacteraeota bacterium]|nr:monovalent cation:proton antiporter family protein [Candidatus Eremiobacteraeota bacterium]
MQKNIFFQPLLIITLLAFLTPILLRITRAINIPLIVGEIVCGIIVGQSGFDLIQPEPWLDFLYIFGFTYLMFISGLEIDFGAIASYPGTRKKGIRDYLTSPVALALWHFILTLFFSTLTAWLLYRAGMDFNIWIMALILSTTSLGIVMPILKAQNLLSDRFGQLILISAVFADFATMILLTIVVAVMTRGLTFDLLILLILFVAFFGIYRIGAIFRRFRSVRRLVDDLAHATSQIRVRGAFATILVFLALSQAIGSELILGAFLAGMIISLLSGGKGADLRGKLDAIGFGFFIPIFFIMVGVQFNIKALLSSMTTLLYLPILIVAAYIVKLLPSFVFRRFLDWKKSVVSGILLSSRLALIIAAGAIGLQVGAISEATYSAIVIIAIFTSLVSPTIFQRMMKQKQVISDRVIIVGGGEEAWILALRLQDTGHDVYLIEPDPDRCIRAKKMGLKIFCPTGDVFDQIGELAEPGVKALVAMTSDDEKNINICKTAHSVYGIDRVIAKANDPNNIDWMKEEGIEAISPERAMILLMDTVLLRPHVISLITGSDMDTRIVEVTLTNPDYAGLTPSQFHLPGDCLVLTVTHKDETVVSHGDTVIKLGDTLALIGSKESIEKACDLLSGPSGYCSLPDSEQGEMSSNPW